jgi:uncharacterized protein (TIGR01777 family)
MSSSLSARRIVIAGGSGFLGVSLAQALRAKGCEVIVLSRSAGTRWDARTLGPWAQTLDGADALINLAGRSVDCIKTPDHQDEILRSRVESTLVLGLAMRQVHRPPPLWVQMSTAHIYGDPPQLVCDESSPAGLGLAPTVGKAWEQAFAHAKLPEQRGVVLRTSFVIAKPNAGGAGALGTLARLARLGLGGKVGSGRQGFSWLHDSDLHAMIERALTTESMQGIYVASSPSPVSQAMFMRELRRAAGGLGALGFGLPAPAPLVRLGAALVLRTDPDLALYGRYVMPTRLLREGFIFQHPTLAGALGDILGN